MKSPKILGVSCSHRKKGYSASLLLAALDGARSVGGLTVEVIHLSDYEINPCTSCFSCIRDPEHTCILNDDFGRNGKGVLFQKIADANALIVSHPVYMWDISAQCHLFFERLYPFVWKDTLNGIPFASISCASNQGMHMEANRTLCKFAFEYGMKYIGGLPVHLAFYDEAIDEAKDLGMKLAEAAVTDFNLGRQKMDDTTRWTCYLDKPWKHLDVYLENLTRGSLESDGSIIEYGLKKTFKNKEAIELLKKARKHLDEALRQYKSKNITEANLQTVYASSYWTNATWKEFLESQVVGAKQPVVYKPLPKN